MEHPPPSSRWECGSRVLERLPSASFARHFHGLLSVCRMRPSRIDVLATAPGVRRISFTRAQAVADALQSLAIESLDPGPKAKALAARYAESKIDLAELNARLDRFTLPASNKPAISDDTRTPDNLAGIQSCAVLATYEARSVFQRLLASYADPIPGRFDTAHLLAIHHALFRDVYSWAGEIRACDMTLGRSVFCRAQLLQSTLASLFDQLDEEDFLSGLTPERFAERSGFYLSELNAIHPFRDGNGRTQRELLRQLGLQAGHRVRWAPVTRFVMYNGSRLSMATGKPNGLVYVMQKALT